MGSELFKLEEEKEKEKEKEMEEFEIKGSSPKVETLILISQYSATSGPFVDLCKCEIYEKLSNTEKEDNDLLLIKEATTGYYDPQTGQETGNFVTYVIEFGVQNLILILIFSINLLLLLFSLLLFRNLKLGKGIAILNY
jgi:hypothetical protein